MNLLDPIPDPTPVSRDDIDNIIFYWYRHQPQYAVGALNYALGHDDVFLVNTSADPTITLDKKIMLWQIVREAAPAWKEEDARFHLEACIGVLENYLVREANLGGSLLQNNADLQGLRLSLMLQYHALGKPVLFPEPHIYAAAILQRGHDLSNAVMRAYPETRDAFKAARASLIRRIFKKRDAPQP